jgi:hypothetical protein
MKNWDINIGQLYRRFTHVRRFYAALGQPRLTQEAILKSIVRANENSAFGKAHHFSSINSVADFQRKVPAGNYESLAPYIRRLAKGEKNQLTCQDPFMFATTSGTTAEPKFIPINEQHLQSYTHAFQVHNYEIIRCHPRAALGSFLIISSNDQEGFTEAGIPYGAVSGLLNRRQSPIIRRHFALPYELCKVKNVDAKYYLLLRAAIGQDVTAIVGCNPTSFLLLAEQLKERGSQLVAELFEGRLDLEFLEKAQIAPSVVAAFSPYARPQVDRARILSAILERKGSLLPKDLWPELGIMSLWKGGSMDFYLEKLPALFGDVPMRDFGYMASEGRGTVPISSVGAAGPLAVSSHFFEFVAQEDIEDVSPRFYLAHELEKGRRYFIFFTTFAGLYRYNINDLLEVEDFVGETPSLRFVRKGGGISSVTGEKLSEEQVLSALKSSLPLLDRLSLSHCTVAAKLAQPPYYRCFAEIPSKFSLDMLENNPTLKDNVDRFLFGFDQQLQELNPEYKDKRLSRRLGLPRLSPVPPGTHVRLRQQRVMQGAPEAQVKIPLLATDPAFIATLDSLFPAGVAEYCLQNGLGHSAILAEGGC